MTTQRLESIRRANTLTLLRSIRVHGPVARIDLCKRHNMSSAGATSITGQMLRHGLIVERESTPDLNRGRGRPRTLIELDPFAASVVCVKLSFNEIRLVVGDFKGQIHRSVVYSLDTHDFTADSLCTFLIDKIEALRAETGMRFRRFLGICIAVQGVVRIAEGAIGWSPAVSFRNAPVAHRLARAFDCPVQLENDTNCIGKAIVSQPDYHRLRNLVVIMLGYGVGMCVFIDGKLYRGATGSSGEFGHTKYEPDGALCACGARGCIEAYLSDYAMYRDARPFMHLPEGDAMHPSEAQMKALTDLGREGHPVAVNLFQKAGRVLGAGLANVVALFNPEQVLVTGSGVRAFDLMQPVMVRTLEDNLVAELVGATRIDAYPWDRDLSCLGGIATALEAGDPQVMAAGGNGGS